MVNTAGLDALTQRLHAQACVLVTVDATQGSVPRDAGAWMGVFADEVAGTIGGGRVELEATAHAREVLAGRAGAGLRRYPLGPGLGQCCGGVMHLRFDVLPRGSHEETRTRLLPKGRHVALFGGGHVGTALARILGTLPLVLRWIDSRDGIFPADVAENVQVEHSDPVQGAVNDLAPGSAVLVMSFSHAEDLDIVAACLKRLRERGDLPFVGLIGSATKWATFRHRLEERGFTAEELARITSPIGIAGIVGKEPEVIAVAVAAQLLQLMGKARHPEQREGSRAAGDSSLRSE